MADTWGPFSRVRNPMAQFCTWEGQTHYDIINTPVITGPPVLKLMKRIESLEKAVKELKEGARHGNEADPIRQDRPRDHAG